MGRLDIHDRGRGVRHEALRGHRSRELSDEPWLTKAYLNDFDNRISGKTAEELAGDEEFQRVNAALLQAARKAIAAGPCIIHERRSARFWVTRPRACGSCSTTRAWSIASRAP